MTVLLQQGCGVRQKVKNGDRETPTPLQPLNPGRFLRKIVTGRD